MAPSPYSFIISICPVDMNVYARFDEIPSMTLKDTSLKNVKVVIAAILSIIFFGYQTPSCICLMSLHCVGKVSKCSIKSCGRS